MKSVEDIRKFSQVMQRKNDRDNPSNNSIGFPNRILVIGSLFGMFATYFHFFGYSYLKAKLEGLGFDYVDVDLSIQESIYIAIEGFAPAIIKLASFESLFQRIDLIVIVFVLGISIPLFFHLIQRNGRSLKSNNKTLFEMYFYQTKSLKSLPLMISTTIIASAAGLTALIVSLVSILGIAWLIAALGMMAGHKAGRNMFAEGVCFKIEVLSGEESYQGCRKIRTKDGKNLVGKKVYKNDEYIYFITNSAAYELSKDLSINMFVPYVKVVVEKNNN